VLLPAAVVVCTVNEYGVPLVRPVIVAAVPVTVFVAPPGDAVT
jgi:hypothetical protein